MSTGACNRLLGIDDCNKLIITCLPIQANWEKLGTHLNVTRGSIQTAREDNGDSTRRLAALITIWLKRERREDHPSWRKLCEAMLHIDRALAEKIAGEHQCSHGDCKVSLKKTKEFDIRHTTISPTASAVDIFRRHSADITSLISDPTKLGNELVSADLIAKHVVDGLASQIGVSYYDRASKMVSVISQAMLVSQQSASQILLNFCVVLGNQQNIALNEIVEDIVCQLGGKTKTIQVDGIASDEPKVKKEIEASDGCFKPEQVNVVENIKTIFKAKEEALQLAFSENLPEITSRMWDQDMIGPITRANPSYQSIIQEFFNALEFVDESGLEQECEKFLDILLKVSVRGAAKKAVLYLQRKMEELGLKININDKKDYF